MLKPYQIAYKNLLRKKFRSLLTIIGIALSAWVLASLLGFNRGYEASLNKDIDNMGFQVLVTAKGCPYEAATLMLKGGTGLRYMPQVIMDSILKEPEVGQVTPMLMQAVFDPDKGESGGIIAYLGVDPSTFPAMKSFLEFKQGQWFTKPKAMEAVLGYEAAELEQREIGDKMLIPEKNIELTVVGILKRTGTQDDGTIFLPIQTVQNVFQHEGSLTGIGIKVKKDQNISALEEKMYHLPDVQVISMAQVKQTIMSLVSTAKVMVLSIALIAILIALVGVINTILMSVMERYHEIGILKSMGALPSDIFKMIWLESLWLCLSGGLTGIFMAILTSQITELLIRRLLPYAPSGGLILITPDLIVQTIITIVLIGLLSGLYPSWKASRIRPLKAIQSEVE